MGFQHLQNLPFVSAKLFGLISSMFFSRSATSSRAPTYYIAFETKSECDLKSRPD
jgi:hypothetical protein